MTLTITVLPCKDNPALAKCPRCWRWHPGLVNTPWSVESAKDGVADRHRLCARCEDVLLEGYPTYPVTKAICAHHGLWEHDENHVPIPPR